MLKTIRFDKEVYSKNAIDTAIKDYKSICSIHMHEKDSSFVVCMDLENTEDKNSISDEFCNYVLSLMK